MLEYLRTGILLWRDRFSRLAARITPRQKRWLRLTAQAVIIIACLTYLAFNARELRQYQDVLQIRPIYLLGAGALTMLALALGAIVWGLALHAVGVALPWEWTSKTHLNSNLAKYVPGYGWQLVSKAYLTRQRVPSTSLVSLAILTELVLLFLTGMVLAAVIALFNKLALDAWLLVAILVGGVVAFVGLILWPFIARSFAVRFWNIPLEPIGRAYWLAMLIAVVAWLCFGVSFWLIGATFFDIVPETIPLFVFTLAGSMLISLAVLIIPGGFGVRESIMVMLLLPVIGSTPAVIIAAASRVVLLLCELLAALIVRPLAKTS